MEFQGKDKRKFVDPIKRFIRTKHALKSDEPLLLMNKALTVNKPTKGLVLRAEYNHSTNGRENAQF